MDEATAQRLTAHVQARMVESDREWCGVRCIDWTGALTKYGYGRVKLPGGKSIQAHRLVWKLTVGPIADELDLDHLCRNRACCNVAHLEPATRRENIRRGLWGDGWRKLAARTHCKNGHEYTEANTYIRGDGARVCRECRNAWARRNSAR